MLLRSIRAELMKCRRSPVWLAFVVLPLFPAILGTVNYLGNLEVLESQWYSLWTQHVLFASLFFLPAQLGVFCAWQWRLEHTDHNWNQAMTAPVPARDLYLAKLILAAGVSFLAQAAIGVLFVISGKLVGIDAPIPPELPGWLFFGALGGAAVCALQLYLSLVIRAFAIPVAIALVGGIAGLMLTSQGLGYAFPYSLLCLGMRANNPTMALDLGPFLLGCGVYVLVFFALSVRHLTRRDVSAGEMFLGGGEFRRPGEGAGFRPAGRVTLPMVARRRKVHSTPFPPNGENCVRSLAPPLPGEPVSLGFAGSNEGLDKAPPGTRPTGTLCP